MRLYHAQQADLGQLRQQGRLRSLAPRRGADFASNDYLGLAGSGALADAVREALLRRVPVGSGGSRLLRGNHDEHEQLEQEAARFFGCESALYLSSGFAANSALLSTLPQRGDLVIADHLIHASVHEGLRLSRAQSVFASHNDPDQFADLARAWRAKGGRGRIWLAVESLYSMDGDRAPLDALHAVARSVEGVLVVDEAHAAGVYGGEGRGLAAALQGQEDVVTLVTCGKALGCEGALVCAPQLVKDFLINRGRGFIFSTAPSPLMAAAVRAALGLLRSEPERRARLAANVRAAEQAMAAMGLASSGSQIVPIVLGEETRTMDVARTLQAAGFDVRGIRPPTVPPGTSRLRVSITLNVAPGDIRALFEELSPILAPAMEPA